MKKSYNLIPLVLLVYMIVMAIMGWKQFADKPLEFGAIIVVEIGIIVLLRFVLRKRYKFREEMKRQKNGPST